MSPEPPPEPSVTGPPDPAPDPSAGSPSAASEGVPRSAVATPTGSPSSYDPSAVRNRRLLLLTVFVLFVLWVARPVLGPFVVAAVLAYAFSPLVGAGQRRLGWPRIAVVGLGYAVAFLAAAVLFYLAAGPLARELDHLERSGPDAFGTGLRQLLGTDAITIGTSRIPVRDIASQLQSAVTGLFASPGDALHIAGMVGELALQTILAIIVMFYFLLDGSRFAAYCLGFLPPSDRERTERILDRIHVVLGRWIRGQLLLIALVAAVVYVVLGPILHLHYALVLGGVSGVLEILPLVGPIAAAALAATVALGQSGAATAVGVVVFYTVLRQIEDQVVMPIVIGRAVHLHPVVTIFAVLVGLNAWGILGGLLGVPVAAALNVTLRELVPQAAVTEA